MKDKMLIDEANGLCAVANAGGYVEFAYCAPLRIYAEQLSLLIGGEWREFPLAPEACRLHGRWVEAFSVRVDLCNCQSVFYRLQGDRVVAGELRTESA